MAVLCWSDQWKVSGADERYLICSFAAVLVLTANFFVFDAALLRCMPAVLDGTTVTVWQLVQVTEGWTVVLGLGWLQMAQTVCVRSFVCWFCGGQSHKVNTHSGQCEAAVVLVCDVARAVGEWNGVVVLLTAHTQSNRVGGTSTCCGHPLHWRLQPIKPATQHTQRVSLRVHVSSLFDAVCGMCCVSDVAGGARRWS